MIYVLILTLCTGPSACTERHLSPTFGTLAECERAKIEGKDYMSQSLARKRSMVTFNLECRADTKELDL